MTRINYLILASMLLAIAVWPVLGIGNTEKPQTPGTPPPKIGNGQAAPKWAFDIPEKIIAAFDKEGEPGDSVKMQFQPDAGTAEFVLPKRIPGGVRLKTNEWVSRTIRKTWLPGKIDEVLVGVRVAVKSIPPSGMDWIFLENVIAGGFFRICDQDEGIWLIWHNPDIQIGSDPGKTVRLLATCMLALPDEKIRKYQIELKEIKIDEKESIFRGKMILPKEAHWKSKEGHYYEEDRALFVEEREWYHSVNVWIASGYFYASFSKFTPGKYSGQAQAGSPPRFLDKVPEEKPEE